MRRINKAYMESDKKRGDELLGNKLNCKRYNMEYFSSPATWFLREKATIVGLTQVGIRAIAKQGITSIVLPTEKDGFVFDEIHDSFYQSLADYAPGVEELCVPPELSIGRYGFRFNNRKSTVCSFKRLVFFSNGKEQDCYIHYNFSEEIESVELSGFSKYLTIDGVIYNSEGTGLLYYPRSKPGTEFVTPATVTYVWEDAFTNTKYLKKLIFSRDLERIGPNAFAHTSIIELVTPSGSIKDNVPLTNAFKNCPFTIPPIIPAFTDEQARKSILEALRSEKIDGLPSEMFKYIKSLDDELIDAFIIRMKSENNRRATIDAGHFCLLMDRMPMTEKLYNAYVYMLNYKDWDSQISKQYHQIHDSLSQFKLYWLSGHKGEVQRSEAFDVGCYITGHLPSKLPATEEKVKAWLKRQIQDAIQCGKKLFITKTSVGVCCLAAETVVELKQQYQDIKLLLFWSLEYEYEKVGFGHWNHLIGKMVYDQKPTDESLKWKPRLEMITEHADINTHIQGDISLWITDHCTRIITTWHSNELDQKLLEYAKEKGIEIKTYD